jgi:signal transduction histidine kinase
MSCWPLWKTRATAYLFTAGAFLLAGVASAQQYSITNWGHKDGLLSTTVYTVTQADDGFLWLTTGDGLIRFDGFQFYSPPRSSPGPQARGRDKPPGSSQPERSGGNPEKRQQRDAGQADPAIAAEEGPDRQALRALSRQYTIRKTLRDHTGAWWIATENDGLFTIARDGAKQHFARATGLPSDHIWDILEDREGDIWAGTQNGLARLRQDKLITYTVRNGLRSDIATALAPAADNGVWVGSGSGLQHFTSPETPGNTLLEGVAIRSLLMRADGTVLAATDSGIQEVSGTQARVPPAASALGDVEQMTQSRNGDLWLYSRRGGLWYWAHGAEPQLINEPALATRVVLSMCGASRDQVWLGLDDGSVILRPPAGSHVFTSADGLTGGAVRFLSPGAGSTLWVASDQGLAYFDGQHFRHWNRGSGLPVERLLWVMPDERGDLWLGSSTGVGRLRIGSLLHPASRSAQLQYDFYDDGDGLKSNPETYGSRPVALTSDGRLWVTMSEGISMIDPAQPARDRLPPPVHILGLNADGHDLAPSGSLQIAPNTRTVQIAYTGISLTEPRKVRFRYRLEGFDRDWQDAGARRHAVYTNLRPGRYTFRVLATSGDGAWNEAGDTLTFKLLPAFYQTSWFLALCALAALTLSLLAYRLRMRLVARELHARYEERIAERTRLAQDLHDSLVQEILGVNLQLEIAEQATAAGSQAEGPLRRALELSRTALAHGRSTLEILRRRPFARLDIENTLRDSVQSMTGSREVVQFDSSGVERLVRADVGEDVVQIMREGLRNAIRHAGPKGVSVCWEYGTADLVFVVRDRGPGIAEELLQAGKPGHFGIRGMHERAARIGAALTVSTSPGAGTEWTLRVAASVAYGAEP